MLPETPSLTEREREELVRLRRDFHRHPEPGFGETRTAGIVAEALGALGLSPRTGVAETGVTALIGDGGRVLMLRADMDALPILEETGRDYASVNEGWMHACGHDGHTATLLTAAGPLSREARGLGGRLKLVFQPAEEGAGGARRMIEAGVLADPKPDAAVGLHYWSGLPTGKLAVTPGPIMAAVDEFHLLIRGKGGHAAMPHQAVDPITAAAAIVGSLQTLVSRRLDPMEPAVCTVAEFHAGSAFNVIAESARLSGTLRCFDRAVWELLPAAMEEIVGGVAEAHGCTHELDYRRLNIPLVNDPAVTALVREAAVELVGEENVVDFRLLGGEDMGDFLDLVPGCFFFVGSGSAAKGTDFPHHHARFDLDEDALALGAEMLVRVARRFLGGNA